MVVERGTPNNNDATPLKHATPRTLRWHWTTVGNEEENDEGEEEDLSEFPDEVFYVTRLMSNSSATPILNGGHALAGAGFANNNGETTPPTTSEEMMLVKPEEN